MATFDARLEELAEEGIDGMGPDEVSKGDSLPDDGVGVEGVEGVEGVGAQGPEADHREPGGEHVEAKEEYRDGAQVGGRDDVAEDRQPKAEVELQPIAGQEQAQEPV